MFVNINPDVLSDVALSPLSSLKRNASRDRLKTISWLSPGGFYGTTTEVDSSHHHNERLKRVSSSSSISSLGTTSASLICWSHLPCNCIESVKKGGRKIALSFFKAHHHLETDVDVEIKLLTGSRVSICLNVSLCWLLFVYSYTTVHTSVCPTTLFL